MTIEYTSLVDDVMRQHPATIRLFLVRRMGCPGCPIACFHTVEDACLEHGVEAEAFLRELRTLAEEDVAAAS
ncbi:DUF1858 domain-containing protein [Aestuariivirga sp.]|uniref:DUF1858 domain-containing protein n=1 Tax=Aestuariivirga sp. TaxID=2650926 RepID=UPI00391ACACD